ncbi:MAG: hypothetical protein ACRDWG_17975 [Actinomycetes bacterium]
MISNRLARSREFAERENEGGRVQPLSDRLEDTVSVAVDHGTVDAEPTPATTEHRHRVRHFVRHLIEMILAMMIGMAALGALWQVILTVCGVDVSAFSLHHPALFALVMALDMTVPMVWWMRHRGHNWARGAEMTAAMFVPTLFLIGLLQLGAISGDSLIGLAHMLMLPAMLLVMIWRLDEYTRPHTRAVARAH